MEYTGVTKTWLCQLCNKDSGEKRCNVLNDLCD